MVLAYLRGFLKPDYPMGIRSHLREQLILESVDRDLYAENQDRMMSLLVQVGPNTPAKTISRINELSYRITQCRAFKSLKAPCNVDGLVSMYHALRNSNLVKRLKNG